MGQEKEGERYPELSLDEFFIKTLKSKAMQGRLSLSGSISLYNSVVNQPCLKFSLLGACHFTKEFILILDS